VKSFGDLALELLDLADESKVLAVFAMDKKLGRKADVAGRVAFFAHVGPDLGALALAAVLGVEEFARRSRNSSAGAGGGGGGGAAGGCGGGGGC